MLFDFGLGKFHRPIISISRQPATQCLLSELQILLFSRFCQKTLWSQQNPRSKTSRMFVASQIMTINFDKYAQTGKEFVKKIAFELGDEDNTSRAGALLRATLHTLRDQSSPEESLQFISQLPMFIKAIYVDGWKPGSHKNHVRHLEGRLPTP
jgi:hypothetical protein